jgi:ERCC4-type nuclease
MRKRYSDLEIKNALKSLQIVVDTREQVNDHIITYLDAHKLPHVCRKLDVGDYSATLGESTLEDDVVIERKASIDELCGNVTNDRDRFAREFTRAKAKNLKVFLIIEGATWRDLYMHNYRSKLEPKSLIATLLSWQVRYNITVIFCEKEHTASIIYNTLYYSVREALENGEAII